MVKKQEKTGHTYHLNYIRTEVYKYFVMFQYWFEWRHKCRKKAADARRFQSGANRFVPLNDLEIRVVELSGKGSVNATDSVPKVSSQLESFLAEGDDSDSQPLENIRVQAVPVRKIKSKRSAPGTSKAMNQHQVPGKIYFY